MKTLWILFTLLTTVSGAWGQEYRLETRLILDGRLSVLADAEWKYEKFDIGGYKTEQFSASNRAVQLSYALENPDGRSFEEYKTYRYEAAVSSVWKEMEYKNSWKTEYPMAVFVYQSSMKGGKTRPYRKIVACLDCGKSYLTVTLVVHENFLENPELIGRLLSGVRYVPDQR